MLDEDLFRAHLARPLVDTERDPLASAQTGVRAVIGELDRLASRLEGVGRIAQACRNTALADLLSREGGRRALRETEPFRWLDEEGIARAVAALADLEAVGARWGNGEGFVRRALASTYPEAGKSLLALMFDPFSVVAFRKAVGEIMRQRFPPSWIRTAP